ncbi:hypothetical protein [Vibrio parahaemolyticus]|uniref:hypothetical protein n=1 Tax=Vibrio parahaemolyticus TaxID=670 RepID=UPI001D4BDA33|nr:hypothetical protein [Vibrio parahaemolyticus]EHJ9995261.1 hypothetical protein [Vibrio parahaemolyticus]MCG0010540.1 hypothetical protein [Vibrio parahaemolyticus]MDL2023074.1 hypothetical protein [Vibrio parahaemolyticus]MDL2027612.1 hypothetical protein [Vibrio parahaemolyticus]
MESDDLMRKINSFAQRSFRDNADRDYIHARMAYRAQLYPQFLWSSLHALEKYAKCILILTRTERVHIRKNQFDDVGHEVLKALELLRTKLDISLSNQTLDFIQRLENGARFRYLEVSWHAQPAELTILDRAVWELRRFCNSRLYCYANSPNTQCIDSKLLPLRDIENVTYENTYISGGRIEELLKYKSSPARKELVWKNLYYSNSTRKTVMLESHFIAENSDFFLHPELLDAVVKYTRVPREIINAYKKNS